MASFSDATSYYIGDDKIPRYRCSGNSYRDKVKNNLPFEFLFRLEDHMNYRLQNLKPKKNTEYSTIFNRTDTIVLPDPMIDYKSKYKERKNKKKKCIKKFVTKPKNGKEKQLKMHRIKMAGIIDDGGWNDSEIEQIYATDEEREYQLEILEYQQRNESHWGANIYEYNGDKRTNINKLINYNFRNDTYDVTRYKEPECMCYDDCDCRLWNDWTWNNKNWVPPKDLVYKLVEGKEVFKPNYKKISEILEFMRTKEHRKAYRKDKLKLLKISDNLDHIDSIIFTEEQNNYEWNRDMIDISFEYKIEKFPDGSVKLYKRKIEIHFHDIAKI